jgi:hypothetical protein
LKKEKELEELDPESTDIFESGALEYYLRRPRNEQYENLTFLEFMRQICYTHTLKNIPKSASNVIHTQYKGKNTYYFFR